VASTGEYIRFQRVGGQWKAELSADLDRYAPRQTLPVATASSTDIAAMLSWLQGENTWASRARVHVLPMPQLPHIPCVYLGKAGLLGGMQDEARRPNVDDDMERKVKRKLDELNHKINSDPDKRGRQRWKRGPSIQLYSNNKVEKTHPVTNGYTCLEYILLRENAEHSDIATSQGEGGESRYNSETYTKHTLSSSHGQVNGPKLTIPDTLSMDAKLGYDGGNTADNELQRTNEMQNSHGIFTITVNRVEPRGQEKKHWLSLFRRKKLSEVAALKLEVLILEEKVEEGKEVEKAEKGENIISSRWVIGVPLVTFVLWWSVRGQLLSDHEVQPGSRPPLPHPENPHNVGGEARPDPLLLDDKTQQEFRPSLPHPENPHNVGGEAKPDPLLLDDKTQQESCPSPLPPDFPHNAGGEVGPDPLIAR